MSYFTSTFILIQDRPTSREGSRSLRLPRFLDSRHMKMVRSSALSTGPPLHHPLQEISLVYISVNGWIDTGRIGQWKFKWSRQEWNPRPSDCKRNASANWTMTFPEFNMWQFKQKAHHVKCTKSCWYHTSSIIFHIKFTDIIQTEKCEKYEEKEITSSILICV